MWLIEKLNKFISCSLLFEYLFHHASKELGLVSYLSSFPAILHYLDAIIYWIMSNFDFFQLDLLIKRCYFGTSHFNPMLIDPKSVWLLVFGWREENGRMEYKWKEIRGKIVSGKRLLVLIQIVTVSSGQEIIQLIKITTPQSIVDFHPAY